MLLKKHGGSPQEFLRMPPRGKYLGNVRRVVAPTCLNTPEFYKRIVANLLPHRGGKILKKWVRGKPIEGP